MFAMKEARNQTKGPTLSSKQRYGDADIAHRQGANFSQLVQRSVGNSYLQAMAESRQTFGKDTALSGVPRIQKASACGGSGARCVGEEEGTKIQTKLTVGAPDDIYEQEADRVAEQIMRLPETYIQTENGQHDAGIKIQGISASDTLNSSLGIKLDESGGQPLSPSTRAFMEPHFGDDFGHVRLHMDQQAQQTAAQIRARAFTFGHHIWLGKGESEQNHLLMAHELTHVVQQENGNVRSHGRPSDAIQRLPFGITLPSGVRSLAPVESTILTGVYGSSLNYGDIYLSDALGGGGRPFTMYVPFVGTIIQIGPSAYGSPGSNPSLLIHEAAHSWQSQHHLSPAAYMSNSLASQAAAAAAGGDAYCFIPGKPFGEYAAEQIANQAEKGVASITAHMSSVSAGSVDLANVWSLSISRWETPGAPGVVC